MPQQIASLNLPFVTTVNFNPYDKNSHRPAQYSKKKKDYNLKISEILKYSGLSPSLCNAIRKWADRRDACGINLWMGVHQIAELGECTVGTIYRQLANAVCLGILVLVRKGSRGRRRESEYALGSVIPCWEEFLDIKGRKGARLHNSLVLSELKEREPYPSLADPLDQPEPPTTPQPTPPAEPRADENVKIENKEEKKKEPAIKPAAKPKQQPLSQEARDLSRLIMENGTSRPGAFGAVKLAETQGRIKEVIKAVHLAITWLPKSKIKNHGAYLQKLVANPENIKLFYRYLDKPKKKILLVDKASEALAKREAEERIRLQDPLEWYAQLMGVKLTWENRDEIELDHKKSLERFLQMEQELLRKTEAKKIQLDRGE